MSIEAVLLDLDNTLIPSGHTYFLPQLECATMLVKEFGYLSPPPHKLISRAYDIQHMDMGDMHTRGKYMFAQSWVELYKELCALHDREVNGALAGALVESGMKWFIETYHSYPGVEQALHEITIPKVIVTLGHLEIQDYKIKNTNLDKYVNAVEIVTEKTPNTYTTVLEKYKFKNDQTVMIGDNLLLDIQPAIDVGMHAWHIEHEKNKKSIFLGHSKFRERLKQFHSFLEAAEFLKNEQKTLCDSIS